jgi:hypothetical protein
MDNRLHTYEPICNDPLGKFEIEREEDHRAKMREELKEEIIIRDAIIYETASHMCPRCGAVTHSHGKTSAIKYLAKCGEVKVRLRRLRCVACGHIVVPGAELIPESGISGGLAECMCDLASKMPYAKAADSLNIQHGIHMPAKRFWQHIQKEAIQISDTLKDEAAHLYETGEIPECVELKGEKPMIIGIDGGHVRGWKQTRSFEVRCATVATGSSQGPGKERHLENRVGYAAYCGIDEFRQRVSVLALKSGYMTASMRIFVSDGATWIGTMVHDYFPDAIHVLDMYHLKAKIHGLFGIKAEGEDALLRDRTLSAAGRYDPNAIVVLLSLWNPPDKGKAEARDDLIGYVENNAEAIRNHSLVSIHGSGWIEKGVDLMVSRRLKNRGMAWTTRGCSNMLPFAVLRYNHSWGVYWNKRKGLSDVSVA